MWPSSSTMMIRWWSNYKDAADGSEAKTTMHTACEDRATNDWSITKPSGSVRHTRLSLTARVVCTATLAANGATRGKTWRKCSRWSSKKICWSLTSLLQIWLYQRPKVRSGELSLPSVKESQRYINLNPGRLFVQQLPKKGKRLKGSFKSLQRLLQRKTSITLQDKTKSNTTKRALV